MCMDEPELLAEFVTESTEALADIENQLLAIEEGGADIDIDLVNNVFRGIHSIKGVASFLELDTIKRLSHRLEDVLNRIRKTELIPTSQIVDAMLEAADQLTAMVAEPETSNEVDVSELLDALSNCLNSDGALEEAASDLVPNSESAKASEETVDADADTGSGAAVEPQDQGSDPESPAESEPKATTEVDAGPPAPPKKVPKSKPKSGERAKTVETSIRVPVSTLDHLMNLAGELVLNRNRLLQYASEQTDSAFATLSSDIDHNTCELQEAIMQTRMQPIGIAFNRFPRIVRDLASNLGKSCELVVKGKDVEVDKSIIEAIGDPLTHLIRNSVDHGVESPEQRLASGKPESGTIKLSAYHRAGQVCIDIEDDGGGIDPEKLRSKAVSKGVISQRQASEMGVRESLQLIFHPGFSTAEKLTDVSGRGVGMDVVRTNIERIGGHVDVESVVGSGTTIRIVLPLTLAIIRSLIVSSQDRRFAIPQVNVAELVRVSESERDSRIAKVNDANVLRLRDELIPLIDLREELKLVEPLEEVPEDMGGFFFQAPRRFNVVILETGRTRYGVIVDELHDSVEIVVKPLGKHLENCQAMAGATILGDGNIALILDASGIAAQAQIADADEASRVTDATEEASQLETLRLLLFRNSPEQQFAIPMMQVARIERFVTRDIESLNGRLIAKYRNGTLPLVAIEDVVSAAPRDDSEHVSVIVHEHGNREIGIIAPLIGDICNVPINIDTESLVEPGVIGSQVVNGVTTRVLDAGRLCDGDDHGSMFTAFGDEELIDDNPVTTVLVAEDSNFFRKRVVAVLEEADLRVLEAADGEEAWELLGREDSIQLLITDIEMPNMDGYQLCEKIRADGKLNQLPIVALTSLANPDVISKVKSCGANDYQMKMNDDELLNAVHSYLSA